MASAKDLRKRIASVKNTQQTTRAMKMVSAAKLRRAQESILNQRPYARRIDGLIRLMVGLPDSTIESELLNARDEESLGRKKKLLIVLVTSDRGLCAGFNSNIIKTVQRWVAENQNSYSGIEFAYVGKRGYDFFKNKKYQQGQYFSGAGGKVTFEKAKALTETLLNHYVTGGVDEIKVVYNEFKNAVSQEVVVENFLPLVPSEPYAGDMPTDTLLVKPSTAEVLQALLEKHFEVQVFRILLESQAGEHGARMSAMENATKNAGEMIKKLTLEYNKQRQAGITKELLEIISGSESQKAG